jgi:hypothetical protein
VAVRKADLDLYDVIVGELASVEKRIKDSEARTLFRLLNVCPPIAANAPPMQLPLAVR